MSREASTKINRLLQAWPPGTVALSRWLKTQGAYQQLVRGYELNGWITSIGFGAYARAGDAVEWTGGLYALQEQMKLPVHVAAKTALQLQGYAHYLPLGEGGPVSLFGASGTRLPAWFRKHCWGNELRYTATKLFTDDPDLGLTKKRLDSYDVTISAPERAIMEVLYLVPAKEAFDEAGLLMQGLTTLRPHLVQMLLEKCRFIKVKRMFMFLAEACNHAWIKRLDLSNVGYGTGKRVIVKDGRLDAKYKITVPDSWFTRTESTNSA